MNLRAKFKHAAKAVTGALTPESGTDDTTDILTTLKQEHDEVKELLSELEKTETAGRRKQLVREIKNALVPHTKAEQKVVYDAVIALRDKDAQTDGQEGYLEHELASRTLQRLASIGNAASPEHRAAGKVLKELVEHHIEEEERQVWGDVREHFSDQQRAEMNAEFLRAKTRVRIA